MRKRPWRRERGYAYDAEGNRRVVGKAEKGDNGESQSHDRWGGTRSTVTVFFAFLAGFASRSRRR